MCATSLCEPYLLYSTNHVSLQARGMRGLWTIPKGHKVRRILSLSPLRIWLTRVTEQTLPATQVKAVRTKQLEGPLYNTDMCTFAAGVQGQRGRTPACAGPHTAHPVCQ